jgi:hypothetical protein
MMKVELEVVGGIVPVSRKYEIVPSEELEKRIDLFADNNGFGNQEVDSFLADGESYKLTIKKGGFDKEYKINEGLVSPDVLDLLDDIMNEV